VTTTTANQFKRVLSKLSQFGFLLQSDSSLPSVCSLITGEPLRGSWWSHSLAQVIFQVNERLEDHPDVLITKLVSGKVTFVHRNFWSQIVAIGNAREPWQTKALSVPARKLLSVVDENEYVRTDEIPQPKSQTRKNLIGNTARELERKLLIRSAQIHTDSGAHAKILETWNHWCQAINFAPSAIDPDEARRTMDQRLRKMNEKYGGQGFFPWH
jgi:hypothetical protein